MGSTLRRKAVIVGNGFIKRDGVFREIRLPDGQDHGRYTVINEKVFDKGISRANRKADELERNRKKRLPEPA